MPDGLREFEIYKMRLYNLQVKGRQPGLNCTMGDCGLVAMHHFSKFPQARGLCSLPPIIAVLPHPQTEQYLPAVGSL